MYFFKAGTFRFGEDTPGLPPLYDRFALIASACCCFLFFLFGNRICRNGYTFFDGGHLNGGGGGVGVGVIFEVSHPLLYDRDLCSQ